MWIRSSFFAFSSNFLLIYFCLARFVLSLPILLGFSAAVYLALYTILSSMIRHLSPLFSAFFVVILIILIFKYRKIRKYMASCCHFLLFFLCFIMLITHFIITKQSQAAFILKSWNVRYVYSLNNTLSLHSIQKSHRYNSLHYPGFRFAGITSV